MSSAHSDYYERIRTHADAARAARESYETASPAPDREQGMVYLREGLGPLVVCYVEARTAEWDVEFSATELDLFHRALNDWLALWTRCHGVETAPSFTIREAAELLVQTHNVRDVAELLTKVPTR